MDTSRIRKYLIACARRRTNQLVTYQEVNQDCELGLDFNISHDRDVIGEVLGEISQEEHENGRPLLSAIVVKKGADNNVGKGFYDLAEGLGYGDGRKLQRESFLETEQQNVIEFWQNASNYQQYL